MTGQAGAIAERAEIVKCDADGVALSSVSAARIQAFMLEQAAVEPGMRVLEIGSGGCNAALLAELAGQGGQVTTMDIDPEVTGRAERLLGAAGYGRVRVVQGDGEYGWPGGGPYDRIVVTAGAADLAPAWAKQLAPGGRLVVPLRVRGLTRSIAFEPENGYLAGRSYELCESRRCAAAALAPQPTLGRPQSWGLMPGRPSLDEREMREAVVL